MRTILCYGDSNTWGYEPATGNRFPEDVRWPGVLAESFSGSQRNACKQPENGCFSGGGG
jgi:lysophospholipase L1-like esterase